MAITGSSQSLFGAANNYTVGTQGITYGGGSGLLKHSISWSNGEGANSVEQVGSVNHTLTGGSDTIDLNADLDNPAGAVVFTGIKELLLVAPSTNTGNVTVSTSSTNEWDSAIDGTIVLKPGTSIHLLSGNATAYAVTAGTKDLLGVTGTASDVLRVAAAGIVA